MPRKRASSNDLIAATDRFVKQLLARGSGTTVDPPPGSAANATLPAIEDQVDILTATTRYLQVKNKIEPDDDSANSGFFGRARASLNAQGGTGAAPRNGAAAKRGAGRADAAAGGTRVTAEPGNGAIPFVRAVPPAAVSLPDDNDSDEAPD